MTVADLDVLVSTRRTVHGVAEHVLAATARRATGSIRLRVVDGALSTPELPGPVKRLELHADATVVRHPGGRAVALGPEFGALSARLGVPFGLPDPPDRPASGVGPRDRSDTDPAALAVILGAWVAGDAALRGFAPEEPPVVWPEHLDVAVTVGEVNYGVSPGDEYSPEPYAYVGPHRPRTGAFFNAPFGAARSLTELAGQFAELPAAIRAFFVEGRGEAGA
jgi:hypothetical protein